MRVAACAHRLCSAPSIDACLAALPMAVPVGVALAVALRTPLASPSELASSSGGAGVSVEAAADG